LFADLLTFWPYSGAVGTSLGLLQIQRINAAKIIPTPLADLSEEIFGIDERQGLRVMEEF
jgi:hypothetical protein